MADTDYDPAAEQLRMEAYYYGFEPTGVLIIDRILSAVATAGKRYHNTEAWNDPWDDNEVPQIDLIQQAAQAAAEQIRRERSSTDVHPGTEYLHRPSTLPASSGEHRGRHFCPACTWNLDDFVGYVDWPCPTAIAVAEGRPVAAPIERKRDA